MRTIRPLSRSWSVGKQAGGLLIVEISTVDGIDVEFGLDNVKFTEMSSTMAVRTNTCLSVMMAKVCFEQLSLRSVKVLLVQSAIGMGLLDAPSFGRYSF